MLKFLIVVIALGVLVYLTVRVIERRGVKPVTRRPPPRVMGPDDDPDFIWDLNKKTKKKDQHPDDPPPAPTGG